MACCTFYNKLCPASGHARAKAVGVKAQEVKEEGRRQAGRRYFAFFAILAEAVEAPTCRVLGLVLLAKVSRRSLMLAVD